VRICPDQLAARGHPAPQRGGESDAHALEVEADAGGGTDVGGFAAVAVEIALEDLGVGEEAQAAPGLEHQPHVRIEIAAAFAMRRPRPSSSRSLSSGRSASSTS